MELEADTHTLSWIASKRDSSTAHSSIITDSISLLQKENSGMGRPDWHVTMLDIHLGRRLREHCTEHAEVNQNDRADGLAGKATFTSGLRLGRSEVLRSLRHYLRAQSQGHHNHQSPRGRRERRRKTKRSTIFLGRTRKGHRSSDQRRNSFKGNTEENSERRGRAHAGFPKHVNTLLN